MRQVKQTLAPEAKNAAVRGHGKGIGDPGLRSLGNAKLGTSRKRKCQGVVNRGIQCHVAAIRGSQRRCRSLCARAQASCSTRTNRANQWLSSDPIPRGELRAGIQGRAGAALVGLACRWARRSPAWRNSMKTTILPVCLALFLSSGVVFALDASNWNSVPQSEKLAEIQRVLGNIKRRGCTVRFSAHYYVRQLDDFYANIGGLNVSLPDALGLIAMTAGEVWDC